MPRQQDAKANCLDVCTDSPNYNLTKCMETSKEDLYNDPWAQRVNHPRTNL